MTKRMAMIHVVPLPDIMLFGGCAHGMGLAMVSHAAQEAERSAAAAMRLAAGVRAAIVEPESGEIIKEISEDSAGES